MWRGLFVVVGFLYAGFCLIANTWFLMAPTASSVDKSLAVFEQVAQLFPLFPSFRVLPAYYLIFQVEGRKVETWRARAIVTVETALKTDPNSVYLQGHLHNLRRGSP